ncbi:heparan-alpha-glucosaminide N-acetyltransferase [Rhodovulum kholense]|uniref:Putative membrane protein n=1 Tax=Rhodovulum kholense TaxID=453584 RepID=A0A8E3ARG2_9RHOB|nr:heparan-alpha-glucosaminide N-acetyltransferase [Rhodovulum kholense]PTW50924.1 putative membrane protein [Rhodovulum kholense]
MTGPAHPLPRIAAIDLARSAALLGMAVFHFSYDLEMFGHLPPGTVVSGGFRVLSVTVAAAFLALAGVSLQLAHRARVRPRAFLRRLLRIAAAAGAVSLGTWAVFPDAFVYFGILHAIATASLLGLFMLRLPPLVPALLALAVLLPPRPAPIPDLAWLDWTGLTATPRPSVDFEPLFPWVAAFLAGMALGGLARRHGLWDRLSGSPGRLTRCLAWPGRHSLAIYLIHQPVLIALVWGLTRIGLS